MTDEKRSLRASGAKHRPWPKRALLFLLPVAAIYLLNASWLAPAGSGTPFLVAHRGLGQPYDRTELTGKTCTAARLIPAGHRYLENTLPSIEAALDFGAAIVEFDVQPTRDGRFAVFHDATLDCRTDGTGRVRDHTLAELKALDIGYGYTDDAGRIWPFRGTGVGLMPSLEEVLVRFPEASFLIDVKAGNEEDGRRLGERLAELSSGRSGRLIVYAAPATSAAVQAAYPAAQLVTRRGLKQCLLWYALLGWSGYVPAACGETLLTIPANVAPWLWGWPNRFTARMENANSRVVLLGDYSGEGFSTPFDDPARLESLPVDYGGGIWTDRIDLLATALTRQP